MLRLPRDSSPAAWPHDARMRRRAEDSWSLDGDTGILEYTYSCTPQCVWKSMQKSKFGCWLAGSHSHSVTTILAEIYWYLGKSHPVIWDQRNLLHGWQILRSWILAAAAAWLLGWF
jgi:hypothetical protein